MTRIEKGTRKISWTETRQVAIGYTDCVNCGAETPEPPMDVQVEYAQGTEHGGTLWPGNSRSSWMPPGWSWHVELGLLCPECTGVVRDALATRKRAQRTPP